MDLSNEQIKEYTKRLLLSRLRILCNNGFYGLLLMHMTYSINEECMTAATDGYRIMFNPQFLDSLNDNELDFVMMHEILHVVLQHCFRAGDRDADIFNIACDIVVNSNILLSEKMDLNSITIRKYGPSMHIAPDGNEGYEYTTEEVYEMLSKNSTPGKGMSAPQGGTGQVTNISKGSGNGMPQSSGGNRQCNSTQNQNGNGNGMSSSQGGGGRTNKGQNQISALGRALKKKTNASNEASWDDHTKWGIEEEDDELREVWSKRFVDAVETIQIRDPSNTRGLMPAFVERLFKELMNPQTDWRTILNEFIQEEIVDYSFAPPDRRLDDCPFFLPDFNEKDDIAEDILFMIDTSGSMSDAMITAAYSEVNGAIDQFDGKLKGWLGFFDAAIIEPRRFEDEDEFKIIKPAGGGGTDFQIIFEYVHQHMQNKPPVCIIILTDGYAPFPKEHLAGGIPVLWLLNNNEVEPPWGKIARIVIEE